MTVADKSVLAPGQLPLQSDSNGCRFRDAARSRSLLTRIEVRSQGHFAMHAHESEPITQVLERELRVPIAQIEHSGHSGGVTAIPGLVPHAVDTGTLAAPAVAAWSLVLPTCAQIRSAGRTFNSSRSQR